MSEYSVHTQIEVGEGIWSAVLRRAGRRALEHEGAPSGSLTIVLTGDEGIQNLNRQFLGEDRPTDVLAFPFDEIDPDVGRRYLGDIIISVPQAEQGAGEAGHSLEAELTLLTVHGVLHLLGYNHAGPLDLAQMRRAQAEILGTLGKAAIVWDDDR